MAPPASFIEIDAIPFSRLVTQAEFNVADEIWFRYVATTPIVLGLQVNEVGTFIPYTVVYESDGTTFFGNSITGYTGHWRAITVSGDYYIRVTRNIGGSTSFDFTLSADTRPLDTFTVAAGDIIINDDRANLPAVLVSSAGVVKAFISNVPGGEFGAILPSNISFWHDLFGQHSATDKIAVLDANFELIASVNCGGITAVPFGVDLTNDRVYVVILGGQLWTINEAGVAANTGYVFSGVIDFPTVIAVNPDGTILYWTNTYNTNPTIHALDLTSFTDLTDIVTSITGFAVGDDSIAETPNFHAGDMFVMPNGNIVTWWVSRGSSLDTHLLVYNSSGTLLYTYDYTYPTMQIDHLAYIHEDSDHILVWWYTNDGNSIGRFGKLALATGVITEDFTLGMYSEGAHIDGTDMFGASNSCTFLRLLAVAAPATPTDLSGIYFINTASTVGGTGTGTSGNIDSIGTGRHDKYYDRTTVPIPDPATATIHKKIPDPTIKTALLGE